MLRDASIPDPRAGTDERRRETRATATGELCLAWTHDPATTVRLPLLDRSDDGFRVRSSLPVLTGSIGRVHRILPTGEALDESVQVAWIRSDDGGWELGLSRLSAF